MKLTAMPAQLIACCQSYQQQSLTRHTLGDYTGGWDNSRRYSWRYVLDMAPIGAGWQLVADFYNEAFLLQGYLHGAIVGPFIEVPAKPRRF